MSDDKPTLREKFQIKPFEWWEIAPFRGWDGFRCFIGTWQLFGPLGAFTQLSPLINFLNQAVRGFRYRHYFLVVDERAFKFSDGKGCSVTPVVIKGGKS